ncbi:hypothetical protein [Halopseudomonas salegens]|uniref:Uncharacterized protein n=1 Tax=Halopseudomonas salegens TaxID=1434072 RepID=A0A1H2E1V7_9GAMM|nr:hypothetical protein [Halopseudomonas salegens]SDT89162.1 hypothetical protein SAMN05216210_0242 [Halopseudomonas salegens]
MLLNPTHKGTHMHLVPYIFLFLVGMLGLLLLTVDPEGGYHWMGYTGVRRGPLDVGVVRVVGAVLVVLAVLPLLKNKRKR